MNRLSNRLGWVGGRLPHVVVMTSMSCMQWITSKPLSKHKHIIIFPPYFSFPLPILFFIP